MAFPDQQPTKLRYVCVYGLFDQFKPSLEQISGVFTNFRMPELYSIGLGGGSVIALENDKTTIGPVSVGSRLTSESLCCGGSVLTSTDIAIKAGLLNDFGNPDLVPINEERAAKVIAQMMRMIEAAVDRVKVSDQQVPLLVVGGGGVLMRGVNNLTGVSEVIFPQNYQVQDKSDFHDPDSGFNL